MHTSLADTLIKNYKALHSIAWGVLGNPELAEDVIQDVYLRIRTLAAPTEPLAYIRAAVLNVSLNLKRGPKSSLSARNVSVEALDGVVCPYSDVEAGLIKLEQVRQLHKSVARLPNKSATLFTALLQDCTLSEYAASNQLNRNSMGPAYNYGLKLLKLEMRVA